MASSLNIWWSVRLAIACMATAVSCGSMATWKPQNGAPQVAVQDDATGKIYSSLCGIVTDGTDEMPIVPMDGSTELNPTLKPRNGTELSGTGYIDGNNYYVANIRYQNEQGRIVEAMFTCDDTGHYQFMKDQNWIISTNAPSVSNSTGLSTGLIGQSEGYRLFYRDQNSATAYLNYQPSGSNQGWTYGGQVSQDNVSTSSVIGMSFTDAGSFTVVTPRDEENIEVSTLKDGEWKITTFPHPLDLVSASNFSTNGSATLSTATNETNSTDFGINSTATTDWELDAWDGTPGNLGIAFDDDGKRSIFYIGTDRALHQITEQEKNSERWDKAPARNESEWPLADEPNAPFAMTSEFSRNNIWIYYTSGGNLTQVSCLGNIWRSAVALPQTNTTVPISPTATPRADGLSTGQKAGIGVGASLGGVAVITMVTALICVRRRRAARRKDAQTEATAASMNPGPNQHLQPHFSPGSSSNTDYSASAAVEGMWVDGRWVSKPKTASEGSEGHHGVQEPAPLYEMASPEVSHEMLGEGHYREMRA